MAGSLTVIGGHSGPAFTGLVSVPSAFADSINTSLQTLLSAATAPILAGLEGLTNFDVAGGSTFTSPSSVGGTLYEITNTDSLGAVTGGTITGTFVVPTGVNALIVQAPGAETITGNGTTSIAIFGANSSVDYSVATGSGSIFAAGGADSISIGAAGMNPHYSVFTSGNDTVNLVSGDDTVDAMGASSTTLMLQDAAATVTAADNSTVSVVFGARTGGTLDFINNSSGAATIFSGAYTLPGGGHAFATNAVTAFGGAGGGFFVGGFAGNNSLIGGTGDVTLQGGGTGDVLEGGGANNVLFGGPSNETLLGSSASGANSFQIGLTYVGLGTITGTDVVSTEGSGVQSYLLGSGDSTLTGSTVVSANNVFDLIRNDSVGSATYTITDFASINGVMFIGDGTGAGNSSVSSVTTSTVTLDGIPTPVTTVALTDGTQIKFDGVTSAGNLSITTDTAAGANHGLISITYNP